MPRLASSHPGLAFPKGPTAQQRRMAKRCSHRDVVAHVRAQLFAETSVCAICGDTERESLKKYGLPHQMHEDPSRAKTLGQPPEDRFNLRVCMRVCSGCHYRYGVTVRCEAHDPSVGWAGAYDVQVKWPTTGWSTVLTVRARRAP